MSQSGFTQAMSIYSSPGFAHECKRARRLIAGLLGADGVVRFSRFRELDLYIQGQFGFRIVKAEALMNRGQDTGYIQWFYRYNHVWVRLKDQPRGSSRSGHMAVILADGGSWIDELAKFCRSGQLVPKQGFVRRLSGSGDHRSLTRTGATVADIYAVEDAWANQCHFNLPDEFDWGGGEAYL